jgi:hypothetical protein
MRHGPSFRSAVATACSGNVTIQVATTVGLVLRWDHVREDTTSSVRWEAARFHEDCLLQRILDFGSGSVLSISEEISELIPGCSKPARSSDSDRFQPVMSACQYEMVSTNELQSRLAAIETAFDDGAPFATNASDHPRPLALCENATAVLSPGTELPHLHEDGRQEEIMLRGAHEWHGFMH